MGLRLDMVRFHVSSMNEKICYAILAILDPYSLLIFTVLSLLPV